MLFDHFSQNNPLSVCNTSQAALEKYESNFLLSLFPQVNLFIRYATTPDTWGSCAL